MLTTSNNEARPAEIRAIQWTIITDLLLGVSGLLCSWLTCSWAVLLDAMYSLIVFVFSLSTLCALRCLAGGWSRLVLPLTNLVRGLLIGGLILLAVMEAIVALFAGGRPVAAAVVAAYELFSALACILMAAICYQTGSRLFSPLVVALARNWLVDGFLSMAVVIAFAFVLITECTWLAFLAPFADPVIVIVLAMAMIGLPIKIVCVSWHQLKDARDPTEYKQLSRFWCRGRQ